MLYRCTCVSISGNGDYNYVTRLAKRSYTNHYVPIIVMPHLPQFGNGWRFVGNLLAESVPRVGHLRSCLC